MKIASFADLESGLWGVARGEFTALGASPVPISITDDWELKGDGVDLALAEIGERSEIEHGYDQLCRVTGRVSADGVEHQLDCLGLLGERTGRPPSQSVREVSAWFEPTTGVALSARRARGARDHGSDEIDAVVFEDELAMPVADPRLSTTYSAGGSPARVGLELWLDAPPPDDEHGNDHPQYPRRVAGEALDGRVSARLPDGHELEARLLRCHSRGLEGAGIYLMLRPG